MIVHACDDGVVGWDQCWASCRASNNCTLDQEFRQGLLDLNYHQRTQPLETVREETADRERWEPQTREEVE